MLNVFSSVWLCCYFYNNVIYNNVMSVCGNVNIDVLWFAEKEYRLYFRVKFYAIDPSVLQDNTRYQFFLQLKNDIASERCVCLCLCVSTCACSCVCACVHACICLSVSVYVLVLSDLYFINTFALQAYLSTKYHSHSVGLHHTG